MKAGRRHETPESETKELISHRVSSSQSISISVLVRQTLAGQMISEFTMSCIEEKNSELKKPESFIIGIKLGWVLLQRRMLSLSSKVVHTTTIIENKPKGSQCLNCKTWRNTKHLCRIIFQH